MPKEKICQFNLVKVNIPQRFFIRLFYCKRYLTPEESAKIGQKLAQIEQGINKLLHARSVAERILLKRLSNKAE